VVDGEWTLVEFLVGHGVQGKSRDWGVWVLVLLGQVSNKVGDVLFQLRQVQGNVVLVEHQVTVVLHVAGNGQLELAITELVDHSVAGVLNLNHLVLDVVDLRLLLTIALLGVVDLLLEVLGEDLLLGVAHLLQLLVVLDLLTNLLVLLLDQIDVGVEHVHVVEQGQVLFFSFDESRYNFFN